MKEIFMNRELLSGKAEALTSLLERYRLSRPNLPEIYGFGKMVPFMQKMEGQMDVFDRQLERLIEETALYIRNLTDSLEQSDQSAAKRIL